MTLMVQVDTREMRWPGPMRKLRKAIQSAKDAEIIELIITDHVAESAIRSLHQGDGMRVAGVERHPNGVRVITIEMLGRAGSSDERGPAQANLLGFTGRGV